MNKLILRDRNGGITREGSQRSPTIYSPLWEGSSIHEEEGHYFVVDDDLREKSEIFYPKINKS